MGYPWFAYDPSNVADFFSIFPKSFWIIQELKH